MQLTPSVTFRGVERTAELEADIAERLEALERFHQGIIGCRVLVELLQRHHEAGNRFHVRIDLTVPGEEIVVTHEGNPHAAAKDTEAVAMTKAEEADPVHKHARVAIHEAFDAARRQLQDYARRQQGSVKAPVRQTRGKVSRLFPIDGYGYIDAEDGHELYFHKNSVLKDLFDQLAVGTPVSFSEEAGDKGPQASTVKVLHPRRSRRSRTPGAGDERA